MFQSIAKFFIENGKLTLVLVLATFFVGIFSYNTLPKQYNPEIIIPAFEITVPASGLSPQEIQTFVTIPLENKVMELEGIDSVYSISGENYAGIIAQFDVGISKENAKIRINQKLFENLDLKPLGVSNPIIRTIDPDELSQITFALYTDNKELSEEEQYIYLRHIANLIKEKTQTVENLTTSTIVGGFKRNIIVEYDSKKGENRGITIGQVTQTIQKHYTNFPSGNIFLKSGEKIQINIEGKQDNISTIKNIILSKQNNDIIYLSDVADVRYGIQRIDKTSSYSGNVAVFLGFGKRIGSNAVFVTDDIKERISQIKQELPNDIQIKIIQDEGATAKAATDMLLGNLFQSILIVVIILSIALGTRNALNVAISIPLTLFSVFTLALLFGENINRITLFALILVLGMLVDDSTVVVENMNRHLQEREKTGKTKLQAILTAIKEVQLGVVLSTVTRLLAFGSMFFVTEMMGEYMGPIPKFALMASVLSTIIALTVNPWISYYLAKDPSEKSENISNKTHIFSKIKNNKYILKLNNFFSNNFHIRKTYLEFMEKFLGDSQKKFKKRKRFKIIFWITLFVVIIAPIYGGIFKARMLPKSNQNQIYLWIDAPRGWSIDKMKQVKNTLNNFVQTSKNTKIIESLSTTSGQAFMPDFANLFRGGGNRKGENQLSARINLYSPETYKEKYNETRISSEEFTILIRPILKDVLLTKYPDLKIKLLEDPPGPPVTATFQARIKSDASPENKKAFTLKILQEVEKISEEEKLVDIYTGFATTYRKIIFEIDHQALAQAKLDVEMVQQTLQTLLTGAKVALAHDTKSLESTNVIVTLKPEEKQTISLFQTLKIVNPEGKQIPLSAIIKQKYSFVPAEIISDGKEEMYTIQAEMGNNSLIYPQIALYKLLMKEEFLGNDYILDSWNAYKMQFIGTSDGKTYTVEWGGEWEVTMDTFRDLGLAMMISLLGIYLILVGQFKNFSIAGIIMIAFLLGFFGVFPGFSILYLLNGEYFSATSMIGIIALAGIVVGNSIILIEYIHIMKEHKLTLKDALLKAGYTRFKPILLTSLTTVLGAATITGDPVWSGLAWAIIWGLLLSSILTLIVIPIFYYDSQKENWNKSMEQ